MSLQQYENGGEMLNLNEMQSQLPESQMNFQPKRVREDD